MNTSPKWLEEKGKINEPLFCKEFSGNYPVIFSENRFYDYDGEVSEDIISHKISKIVLPYVTSNVATVVKRLTEALKLCCFSKPIIPKEDEIHLLNGILKTDGTWIAEKRFCVNRLNINYDPHIWNGVYYSDDFLMFLSDMLDIDDITTLQEYLGYCLIPSTKGQAMLFIIGNGGEGKSRIGIVLQEIFKSAMITGNFQRIETDKFFRYNLQNKLLMLDDDMQMNAFSSTGYIKNLITAEIPVDVEAKGQQSGQAMLYSRFLCFGNGSPKALYDKSDGFARRMIILTTKPVPENRRNDPFLAEKLIADKERIFCWMFDGLRRLIKNNFRFTISEKTRHNITEIMADNCNIPEFLHDRSYISFGNEYSESTQALYSAYVDWCHKNLMNVLNQSTFSSWLRSNSAKLGITATNHIPLDNREVRGYRGLKTHFRSIIL